MCTMTGMRGSRNIHAGLATPAAATLVVSAILAAVAGAGCGGHRVQARRLPAWVFESARLERSSEQNPRPRGGVRGRSDASDFVVAALQGEGLRFGTDGSVPAL